MFLSDGARILQYYSAWRQWNTPVAQMFILNAAFGRYHPAELTPEPRINTPAWTRWDKARKWPVLNVFEMSGPGQGGGFPTPFLWSSDHIWFDRLPNPEFRWAARPTLAALTSNSCDPRPSKRHCP